MFHTLRNNFLAGLFVLLPFAVTIAVVHFVLEKIGGAPSELLYEYVLQKYDLLNTVPGKTYEEYVGDNFANGLILNLVSTVAIFIVIAVFGFFSRYFIGHFFVNLTDRIVGNVPIINTVYKTVKQIVGTFTTQHRAVFQKVVMIEYPKSNSYAIGFLTSTADGEIPAKSGCGKLYNVFVPTTPNPTSGFLLMLPEKEVTMLDMSVGDAMKLIISGGAVIPEWKADAKPKLKDGKG
jgi:uncharacterized membrane protein